MASLTTLALVPGLAAVSLAAPAAAEQLPASYSGSTHSDIEDITVLLGGANETHVISGHATTAVDSDATVKSAATASNLDPAVLGTSIPIEEYHSEQPAGPAADSGTFLPVTELAPAVSLEAGSGATSAAWAGDLACVPAGTPLAQSFTQVDATTVADNVVPTLTAAELGVITTTGTVELIPAAARTACAPRPKAPSETSTC
ncbi:hypothetical protein [Nocardioides allogilvus]|uniref:hypothetical protein n=1 Tax=Nocardioides allogilvus TaxID=2072017 RepID=UPI001300A474|nr:hypothetical protein [Nocardioides allogilvus]